jgi:hypothetical protein
LISKIIISILGLSLISWILVNGNPVFAQGYMKCTREMGGNCNYDGPDYNKCAPGYKLPCDEAAHSICCQYLDNPPGTNCPLQVPCIPINSTPTPLPPTSTPGPSPTPDINKPCFNQPPNCFDSSQCDPQSECISTGGVGVPPGCIGTCRDKGTGNPPGQNIPPYNVCQSAGTLKPNCEQCMYGVTLTPGSTVPSQSNPKVWTAIGCIETEPSQFISIILKFGVGIAGGIAFLLILLGGFQVMTASGNPEQMNGGRELIGAAITGLILIIFSVLILKIIGVDILGIPGFG